MHHDDEKELEGQEMGEAADAVTEAATGAATGEGAQLDLDALDLTVETIEERISPSETNVFDK